MDQVSPPTNHIFISFQCDLEYISLFCLSQKEKHALSLVSGAAHKYHASLRVIEIVPASGYGTSDIRLISKVLICYVILRADKHSTGSLCSTGYYTEKDILFYRQGEKCGLHCCQPRSPRSTFVQV